MSARTKTQRQRASKQAKIDNDGVLTGNSYSSYVNWKASNSLLYMNEYYSALDRHAIHSSKLGFHTCSVVQRKNKVTIKRPVFPKVIVCISCIRKKMATI